MVGPVGFRFRPTDEEIIDHYLRLKHFGGNTSHVDEVISTVDIYCFDPWELPSQSRRESTDHVWFFFGCKKNQHVQNSNRGERQSRKTMSGFWKKTGVTTCIMRKGQKIGEKRVLVFQYTSKTQKSGSQAKSDWVMHEYVATYSSPNQTMMMMTYTVCKVMFKGDERDLSSSSASASGIDHIHSLIPQVNNSSGVLSTETENSRQLSGFLHLEEENQLEDAMRRAINNISTHDFNSLLNNDDDDDDEQRMIMFVQEDRNDYRPKKSQTFVFIGHTDDDSDSDSVSATTSSIQTSSTCVSFGSSIRGIDQIKDLQESPTSKSPTSKIELVSVTQEVGKARVTSIDTSKKKVNLYDDDAQGSEVGGDQMGQEMVIKNERAGFIYRMIQRFAKKIKLCSSSVSRT